MNKLPNSGQLNLVPFIDIMLVLLCIVLSVSSFIATGKINIALPEAQSNEVNTIKEQSFIEVDKHNTLHLDGKVINHDDLKNAIKEFKPERHVELRIDKEANFDAFMQIIDVLKELNHENFSIATTTP